MNVLQQFEKDHLVLMHLIKGFFFSALIAGGDAAMQLLGTSSGVSYLSIEKVFACGFLISMLHAITSYFSASSDTQIAISAKIADALVNAEEPKIKDAIIGKDALNGTPSPLPQQPVAAPVEAVATAQPDVLQAALQPAAEAAAQPQSVLSTGNTSLPDQPTQVIPVATPQTQDSAWMK